MVKRFALPIALAVAVGIFVVFFNMLEGGGVVVRLLLPAALAGVAATGVYFMASRTKAEEAQFSYDQESNEKIKEVKALLAHSVKTANKIRNPRVLRGVRIAAQQVLDLLVEIAESQPSSLYSSATKFCGHVRSLAELVDSYADMEARPTYYRNANEKMKQGLEAIERFNRFTLDSIRLVNQGEMSEYEANLSLVAPPDIPKLDGK